MTSRLEHYELFRLYLRDSIHVLVLADVFDLSVSTAGLLSHPPDRWAPFLKTDPPCHAVDAQHAVVQYADGCDPVMTAERVWGVPTQPSTEKFKLVIPVKDVEVELRKLGTSLTEVEPARPVGALRDSRPLAVLYALGAYRPLGNTLVASPQLALLAQLYQQL